MTAKQTHDVGGGNDAARMSIAKSGASVAGSAAMYRLRTDSDISICKKGRWPKKMGAEKTKWAGISSGPLM
jgi:hypothetical protein